MNDSPTEFFSPSGDKDTTNFQSPRETAGPFAYLTKAKKGSLLDLQTHCLQTFTGRMVRNLLHWDYLAHVFPPPRDGWTSFGDKTI